MLAIVSKPKTAAPATPGHTQTAFRLPNDLLDGLDALVDEVNRRRPWPKTTRSDLVRMVIAKAIEERPEWLLGQDAAK